MRTLLVALSLMAALIVPATAIEVPATGESDLPAVTAVVETPVPSEEVAPTVSPDPIARSIMDTPLADYSVSEGLLLFILLALVFMGLSSLLKGVISWF